MCELMDVCTPATLQEFARLRHSTADLCTAYSVGKCRFGDGCKYNHDVAAFVSQKPPELPGSCPFYAQDPCPYGKQCDGLRVSGAWASVIAVLVTATLTHHMLQASPVAGHASTATRMPSRVSL